MKTVLLTGATGYVGKHAIKFLLDRGFVVHAVSSKSVQNENQSGVFWHQADLLDAEQVKNLIEKTRPTDLLHFAWYVEHGKFWTAAENLDWLAASLVLLRRFAENGGRRAVFAGTCAEYDWNAGDGVFVENASPLNPQTLYGAAKLALFQTSQKFAETADFSFASGRIFFPFGFDESPRRLIPSVIRSLLKNELAKTSHGEQIRDLMFVEDVAAAFVALLDGDARGAVNIGNGAGVQLKSVAQKIAQILQKENLLQIGAIPSQTGEPAVLVADARRLREEVGFEPKNDLNLRLKQTIDYWKNRL